MNALLWVKHLNEFELLGKLMPCFLGTDYDIYAMPNYFKQPAKKKEINYGKKVNL